MKPEKIIQHQIHGALKACGYLSFPIPNRGLYNPRTCRYNIQNDPWQIPGIPDVVVLLPESRVLWIEVKSPKGRTSPAQDRMAQILAERGHYYVLARNVRNVMDWLKQARYRFAEVS